MSRFSLAEVSQNFEIVPLSRENHVAFYRLIQEQAVAHGAVASRLHEPQRAEQLYNAIAHARSCEAFLVHDHDVGAPVTAVTFYDCYTPYGRGLYLEDIVTSGSHRRRGHGTFGLAALAQIALQRGVDSIRWECRSDNLSANNFYLELGSERLIGRQTWRLAQGGAAFIQGDPLPYALRSDRLARALRVDAPPAADGLVVFAGRRAEGAGPTGFHVHRSFSTFAVAGGTHIETMIFPDRNPEAACAEIRQVWRSLSRRRGWGGSLDVSLDRAQGYWLAPALQANGFAPLSYGGAPMIARCLHGSALQALAQRPERDLLARAAALAPLAG